MRGGLRAGPRDGQAAAPFPDWLLPTTSQRPVWKQIPTAFLCLFHIVLLLLEDRFCFCFVLFDNVIYCHVLVLIFS